MNYTKKSEEVFAELFHKSWMKENDWNAFKKRASKIYTMEDFASDLENGFPWTSIDAKLNEIKTRVKV
jgi:hypothetical protein